MDIGITLPNGAPGVDGDVLLEWARRAEAAGFSHLGAIDRIAYPSYDPLTLFGAVAGATERIRMMSTILVGPTREPVLLAKQAASIDRLSGGRFVLGLGVGNRPDDFATTGTAYEDRGRRLDRMLETMHRAWRGEPLVEGSREVCPEPVRGARVPIMFGANTVSAPVIRRIARWGEGFIAAGSPQMVQPIIDALREAWAGASRDGEPRLAAATYFVLGDEAGAERTIDDYYAFMPQFGQMASAAMPRDAATCRRAVRIFEDAGFDEFSFSAASTDPAQVERLAEAVL